jgi:hypothetical protein
MTGFTSSSTDIINFNKHQTPQPIEYIQGSNNINLVRWGINNLYPNFLIELYNDSPLHKSIVNAKVDYITGDGLRIKNNDKPISLIPNPTDSFDEFIGKIINDYLILNFYAVEVIYNKLGTAIQWNHIPAHKIRMNRDRSKFWYGYDYFLEPYNTISYEYWKPGINKDGYSKIFYYSNYAPTVNNIYPTPEYSGAIKAIETDIAIKDFNINNIKNQFSVSSIVTFFGGQASPEVQAALERKLKNSYTGESGGKMIVGFENAQGTPPDVKNISPGEWDKSYIEIQKNTTQDILIAHQAVSPMLFGIKTEGQLGGATELETSYEIFKNLYVKNRRNELESSLNKLFADLNLGELEFKDKGSLFSATLSDVMKMKTYTINEIREEAGLPPLLNGDRLLDEVKPVPVQEPTSDGTTPDVNVVGSPVPPNQVVPPPSNTSSTGGNKFKATYHHLTDGDFEKVKDIGKKKSSFTKLKRLDYSIQSFSDLRTIELQFDEEKDISDYIVKNGIKNMTMVQIKAAIRKDLGIQITTDELRKVIQGLEDSGVINKNDLDKSITIKPTEKAMQPALENIRRVEVRYSYEGPEDDKNRPFCAKLMENDRYYTRADIQEMGLLFGYDIFSYRGGFYHNPETDTTTPYCRHNWQANSVVENLPGEE